MRGADNTARTARAARLAAALRRNLRRRKAVAGPGGDDPTAGAAAAGEGSDRAERIATLAALLRVAAEAHHEAFAAVDGADPEWPLWYAAHLLEPARRPIVERALGMAITESALAGLLERAELARETAPGELWPEFYARFMAGA